jgi:prophage regulatory protein
MPSPATPHDRILRKRDVLDRVPWSVTTLWRRVNDGSFPKPIRIGKGLTGWFESEVMRWMADLGENR